VDIADSATTVAAPPPPPAKPLPPWERPFPYAMDDLLDTGRNGLGGAHEKTVLQAPDGSRWLFKPTHGEDFRAYGEKLGSDLALRLDLPAPEMHVVTWRGKQGTAQRMLSNVLGDFEGGVEAPQLSLDDWDHVQREAAYNYLIGDNDGHTGNFLRLGDGSIVGIDKGQLFKFYNRDTLDWNYNPNQGFHGGSMDRVLLRKYAAGQYGPGYTLPDLDKLQRTQAFFDKLDAMPDADFVDFLRPYATRAAPKRLGVFGPSVGWTEDQFYAKALERKRELRKSWTDYLGRAEAARKKALGLDKPPALVDQQWLDKLVAAKGKGRSVMVAGAQVEDGNVLVYGTANDGTWADLKLRPGADRDLVALLRQHAGNGAPSHTATPSPVLDPHWPDVQAIAKSYNYHLDPAAKGFDGVVPAHTADKYKATYQGLLKVASNPGVTPGDKAMAQHYMKGLADLVHNPGEVLTGKDPAWKTGADAALHSKGHSFAAYVPKAQAAPKAPVPVHTPGIKVTRHTKMGVSKSYANGEITINGMAPSEWDGTSYEVDLGGGVRALYVSHDGAENTYWSKAGLLQVHVDKAAKDLTPHALDEALRKLDKLGIKVGAMDKDAMEALYLRKVAYTAGHLDNLPAFAVAEDLPAAEQVKQLRAAWQGVLGKDPRTLPGYQPAPVWDSNQDLDGTPRWLRFDFDTSDEQDFAKNHVLTADSSRGAHGTLALLLGGTDGMAATEERIRLGITTRANVHSMGMSAERDQETGGASYVFTRLRDRTDYRATTATFAFDGQLAMDVDALAYGTDRYGICRPGDVRQYRRNRTAEGLRRIKTGEDEPLSWEKGGDVNEVLFKRRLSLQHLVRVNVGSASERQQVLDLFAQHGVKTLGGRTVDQIVQVRGTAL
jgi:hypothetical protein